MSSVRSARPAAPVAPSRTKVPYLPGLDGLRAFAVVAVILYHGGVTWMDGGFLGVEVFFVISGYLITLLLLAEKERTGLISLRQFWLRRARRLLPALYVMLAGVTMWIVASPILREEEAYDLRGQLIAAVAYVENWYLIATDASYFDQLGRPPVLQHLWSLAVEEQFYLVWPLVLVGLLGFTRRRLGALGLAIGAMALASTIAMFVMYDAGADPSRVYYGTDTRAAGLLLGSLLAVYWRPGALARSPMGRSGTLTDGLALVAMGGLAYLLVNVDETGPFLYRGGFLLVSALTVVAIAGVAHPRSVLNHALGSAPFRYVGTRSYGLYLWHWPVFVLTRPGLDTGLSGASLWAWRLGLTVALTEVSYRLIETPIRSGALGRWWKSLHDPRPDLRYARRRLGVAAAGASMAVLLPVSAVLAAAQPPVDEIRASLEAGQAALATSPASVPAAASSTAPTPAPPTPPPPDPARPSAETLPLPATTAAPPPADPATSVVPQPADPATTTPPPGPDPTLGAGIVLVGDSVMLGAAPALQTRLGAAAVIDAVVGRQMNEAAPLLQSLKDQGRLTRAAVIHLGNNGTVSDKSFGAVMDVLKDVPVVVVVTVKVPRKWEGQVNGFIAEKAPQYPNVRVVDWRSASIDVPDYFYKDGIHLRPAGAKAYADLIAGALGV